MDDVLDVLDEFLYGLGAVHHRASHFKIIRTDGLLFASVTAGIIGSTVNCTDIHGRVTCLELADPSSLDKLERLFTTGMI